ncbi:hypothetical protein D477_014406 [Arthrobacter crystallopoietes BAB-32]|uniref:DUF4166 domain-containing protein n=1 Tax=Arthrobacter crystallopoietes BAB-32 TaxID=1246476 RepID=N1V5G6_9MICC|nr:DUF4166 domain-containing protein [Arthrobacter crystallopoietes]EMY33508.1 hypothetical protein D477_014406 [Arthrobacter crystallopoietes BAB-32]
MRTQSVYQLALGPEFGRLQPEVQRYFSLAASGTDDGGTWVGVGTGVFEVAGCPRLSLRPLLRLAALDRSLFPDYGRDVPFRIENRPGRDVKGRPSLTAIRTLEFPQRTRTMEDITYWDAASRAGGGLVDVLGRSRLLRTRLECSVGADGRMRLSSRGAALAAGPLSVPLPLLLDAAAFTEQWWDRAAGLFRIRTKVLQRQLGTVLEYEGSFVYRLEPRAAMPRR